jgi:hypothetical protein
MGLTDEQIKDLIEERKRVPKDFLKKLVAKPKNHRKHTEAELMVKGDKGHKFILAAHKHVDNPKSFSVMLRYMDEKQNKQYILMRCNGSSHRHTNTIEKETTSGCHIHVATKRYFDMGDVTSGFAYATEEYSSYSGAMDTLIKLCNFQVGETKRLDDYWEMER